MNFQEYLTNYRRWLLGHYLASEQRGTPGFEAWSITDGLSDDQVSALKDSLAACMPVNSMMLDLWNWDCHFENELEDDWYFGAAFGNDELLDS